jgi:integrase
MARITKPLTNTEVKQAKPKDKVYTLSDGGGLQLRIKPNGSKLWLLDYKRPYTKKRTCLSLGSYPHVTIAQARLKRDQAKSLLSENIDPQEHRDQIIRKKMTSEESSLKCIAEKWLIIKRSQVSTKHADNTWRSLDHHIFNRLGAVPIHKITATSAIDAIRPIAEKGNLETVKRLCQRLNEIMIYAMNTCLITNNPLAGISKAFQTPTKQNLPTLKPNQLPMLLSALNRASIKLVTRCLIEWQLHTMVRPSETAGATWCEIDIEQALWHIPAERMKRKKAHVVPLSEQAIKLLELMHPISGHLKYIFPSDRKPQTHINPQTANMALKRMGFKNMLVAHGLRSLASTSLNEQGFDPDIIESALSHVGKNAVRNAYNRAQYIERRRPMMQWWSDHIDQAATGNMSLTGNKGLSLVV